MHADFASHDDYGIPVSKHHGVFGLEVRAQKRKPTEDKLEKLRPPSQIAHPSVQ